MTELLDRKVASLKKSADKKPEPVKIEITDLPLGKVIERAENAPNYVENRSLRIHLGDLALLGQEFGLGLDTTVPFSVHERAIIEELYQNVQLDGESLRNNEHFPTILDVFATGAFQSYKNNKAARQ